MIFFNPQRPCHSSGSASTWLRRGEAGKIKGKNSLVSPSLVYALPVPIVGTLFSLADTRPGNVAFNGRPITIFLTSYVGA